MEEQTITITLQLTFKEKHFYFIFSSQNQLELLKNKLSDMLKINIEEIDKLKKVPMYNSINPLYEKKYKNGALIRVNSDNTLSVSENESEEILECKEIYSEQKPKKEEKIKYDDYKKKIKINLNFFSDKNLANDDDDTETTELSGILKLCLLVFIANFFKKEELGKIEKEEIKEIITNLQNEIEFTENLKENIKSTLKDKSGNNILEYAKYINEIVNKNDIDSLINILHDKKEEIIKFRKSLSKYKSYNEFFEEEITKHLKLSIFDYSVVSLVILDRIIRKSYETAKKKCPNVIKKFLYHGSQIDPISSIMTTEFKYAKRPFYGMGVYFTDMLDYVGFYCGGVDEKTRRADFRKILPVESTFSIIASEVFYDEKKFKQIENDDLYVADLKTFPSYADLTKYYKNKMVQPNGIHYIEVEIDRGDSLDKSKISKFKEEGKFIGTEYAITELNQIFPLYSLTLKRNEYLIIWRDPNFKGENKFTNYLKEMKFFANQIAKMNIYFETQTEEALKLIERKKYNKIILISSIGQDLSGKKFIEVAREILKCKAICLFFSNNKEHLKWIQNFPNALYTNTNTYYEKFITNFNKEGLNSLKKSIEEAYNINLPKFTDDFIEFPLFAEGGQYDRLTISKKYNFFRHVKLLNKTTDRYIGIRNKNGGEIFTTREKKEASIWDVIIMNNEITLYSNGYYLSNPTDDDFVFINQYMEPWSFDLFGDNNNYLIIKKGERRLNLTLDNGSYVLIAIFSDENDIFTMIDE